MRDWEGKLAASVVVFFLAIIAFAFVMAVREGAREYPCDHYRNYELNDVPVRCLDELGVNGAR